jgi:hypothetical protein
VALGPARVLATIVEIALRDDAEGTNGGEHAAFGAVDLVRAIAFSNWPALTAAWQVEILREHIAQIVVGIAVSLAGAASTAEVAIPSVTIALTVADIVPVPHCKICSPQPWIGIDHGLLRRV